MECGPSADLEYEGPQNGVGRSVLARQPDVYDENIKVERGYKIIMRIREKKEWNHLKHKRDHKVQVGGECLDILLEELIQQVNRCMNDRLRRA